MLYRLWRLVRNSPKWLLIVAGLFVFIVLFQRVLLPSISKRTGEIFAEIFRFDLPFDVSVMLIAIATFVVWSAIKQNFADQADELDQVKRENAALVEEVDRLIEGYKTDNVTKIPNEMKLKSQIRGFLKEHPSRGFSLIYLDIDDFKKINRELGSAKANIILRALAWKLRSGIRREEEIYRDRSADIYRRFVGGDEFVLLQHGDEETCLFFMKRVYKELLPELSRELRERLSLHEEFQVHVSAGSYTFSPEEKRQFLRENADDLRPALYKIMSEAEELCQDAKNCKYEVSYVWNGLVAALGNESEKYDKFRAFFPPREPRQEKK